MELCGIECEIEWSGVVKLLVGWMYIGEIEGNVLLMYWKF